MVVPPPPLLTRACIVTVALAIAPLGVFRSSVAQSAPDPSFRVLDEYLRAKLTRLHVPGAAVAVVRGDSLVHGVVFGRADESGRAVTLETPFLIGSISKSMTALAVMQLVGAGSVALDAPVTRYLPWFHPKGEAGWGHVTIRELLNQDGGIPASAGLMEGASPDTSAGALERHARGLAQVRLAHPPGTTFEYANANYALLGQVIQAVTGTSYERYIQAHLFGPLAMSRSFASQAAAEQQGMAVGYRSWFGHAAAAPGMPFVRATIPAGYLIASAADMARYLGVQLHEGRYRGGALVTPAAMEEMHRPASRMTARWSYAMGWVSGTLAGDTVLWHNGLVPGFYSFAALVPRRREGIVILTNVGGLLDLPRFNEAAFGALIRLLDDDAAVDPLCAACPVFPQLPGKAMLAVRAIAMVFLTLQCAWIARGAVKKRWRSRRGNAISLSCAIVWALFVLLLLPLTARMPLAVMDDLMPDLAAIVYMSVAIALAWACLRVAVAARVGRRGLRTGIAAGG